MTDDRKKKVFVVLTFAVAALSLSGIYMQYRAFRTLQEVDRNRRTIDAINDCTRQGVKWEGATSHELR